MSEFVKNKYWEEERKASECTIWNIHSQDWMKKKRVLFKIILINLYPASFPKMTSGINQKYK